MSRKISPEEKIIWESRPSQWLNLRTYTYCIIVVACIVTVLFITPKLRWFFIALLLYPAGRALFAWYEIRAVKYSLTALRILCREGVFNRVTTDTKLSDLKDVLLIEPWYERIVGLGDIQLNIKGFSESYIRLSGIRNAGTVRDLIDNAVKQRQTENMQN
jgi:uncharacterized membrane protein YdbT with pleckstrin-like domain